MLTRQPMMMLTLVGGLLVAGAGVWAADEERIPLDAKPGECYTRVVVPDTYETVTEQVLKREASEQLEVVPAQFEWVEERMLVQEESEEIKVIPATYETVEETILVKPASQQVVQVPPVYETVSEQVMVKPATTMWQTGTGPLQRVDYATGEILCLVEVPPVYKTLSKQVVKEPATTRTVEVPAEYATIKKRVVKTPARTEVVPIPAKYETVKVQKLVAPAQTKRVALPAEYQTVTKQVPVQSGQTAWQQVLCKTNVTPEVVTQLQQALMQAGYDPGPIDGSIGNQTLVAVEQFQRDKGLAQGGLTLETLKALGVDTDT
jgi:Putative peptidoglycan binding domain